MNIVILVLVILAAVFLFRKEGYVFNSDQQKQINNTFLALSVSKEDQDSLKAAFAAADKDGNIPETYFPKVMEIYRKYPDMVERLKAILKPPNSMPQDIKGMASKYNGFECMMKPPNGFECRLK